MEICISWNICRVCLREEQNGSEKMRGLFGEDKNLLLHIHELSGVSMKPDDSLPDKICQKCVSVISNAIQFRKTCRSSDVYLQSILERAKSVNSLPKPEAFKCEITDDDVELDDVDSQHWMVSKKEHENVNFEKIDYNPTVNYKTKHKTYPCGERTLNIDYQESDVELSDNIPEYVVELEEIPDPSEDLEEQLFPQEKGGDTNEELMSQDNIEQSNIKNVTTTVLEKLCMSARLVEMNNMAENSSSSGNDGDQVESEQFDKGEDENSISNEIFDDLEDSASAGGHVEFDIIDDEEPIDESLLMRLEDKSNDENHAQVSSTVDANDQIEYYECRSSISNASSDIDEGRLTHEHFSNCNISKIKSYERTSKKNLGETKMMKQQTLNSSDERKRIVVKLNGNLVKSTATVRSQKCICEICGNQYENRNLLSTHMKVHFPFKNHRCELCFKSFVTACNLQAHMRIHTGEKPFKCNFCDRRFNDRTSNIRHERTHTNEKPFMCYSCGKSFTLATTLQNHIKVHTNERSYRCEPCGKSFKLSHHLKTHQTTSLHKYAIEAGATES